MTEIFPFLIGGVVLFIHSIVKLSEVLQNIFSSRAITVIDKATKNIFRSLFIGIIFTILLGSSSAIIILTLVFINAKTLSFKQAIGIIMGANIGTAVSSQIIVLDIGKYAIFPMLVGLVFELFVKGKKWKRYGQVLFYLGMLFFGLFLMEESVMPLKESKVFEHWIAAIDNNYIQGTLVGGLITLIIQSSSATVGIAIILGKQNLISIAGGIAVMLGAELGTCSDTLIATINGSRQAIKAGLFHLLFNFITIIIGLIIFYPFVLFIEWISSGQSIGYHIANAHIIFNIAGVILFLPFVGLAEKGLNYLLPD